MDLLWIALLAGLYLSMIGLVEGCARLMITRR